MRTLIIVLVLLAAGVTLLVRAVISSFHATCEVCATYGGRTVCREAVGSDPAEATRIAHERVCAFLAVDAEARRDCAERPPDSAECRDD